MFTIKGLEHGWLAHCQFNVTGLGIIIICGMVLINKPSMGNSKEYMVCAA